MINKKMLITTDNWFIAPDGESYRAVFGTVKNVLSDTETLGIKTNRNSSNWFVSIGDMFVAGCQIHYAIETDEFNDNPPVIEGQHEGNAVNRNAAITRIYNADRSSNES